MSESAPAYAARTKYDERTARKYQTRKPGKHRSELRLVERAFRLIPRGRVLDVPCGGGRVGLFLAQKGYTVTCADLSEPMVEIARAGAAKSGLPVAVERQDLEKLGYAARSFDAAVCFRLFHHFPDSQIRARVIGELCRVAGRHVALSYNTPLSFTSMKRAFRRWRGKKVGVYATPTAEIEGYFAAHGFVLLRDFARVPFVHTLRMAVFERVERK